MESATNTSGAKRTKICPHCRQEVDYQASRCPHCHGKIYVWTWGRKLAAGGLVLVAVIGVANMLGSDGSDSPATPSIQQIALSEEQCQVLKGEFYSLIAGEPTEKTQLAKEVLEQYAFDGGIPVKKSNPNVRYTLPSSDCGDNLATALNVIVEGEKNAR